MVDLLDQGQAWLANKLTQRVARDVIYRRDGADIPVRATLGRTAFEQTDATGAIIRIDSRDFLIDRTSLVLSGQVIEPIEGDTIIHQVDEINFEYEVLVSADGAMYRPCDPFEHKLRIHTKRVRALP